MVVEAINWCIFQSTGNFNVGAISTVDVTLVKKNREHLMFIGFFNFGLRHDCNQESIKQAKGYH